ncbi:MAG: hypothetical protein DRO67_10375 [Candidatus Asgardarchaeum californiense]|nr:MAG: hypothetical protein DRO67_10375 [Candidatus Asgardarchaeum californiense]
MEKLKKFIRSLGCDPDDIEDLYWLFTMGDNLDAIGDPEYEDKLITFFSRQYEDKLIAFLGRHKNDEHLLYKLVDALFDGDADSALYFLQN